MTVEWFIAARAAHVLGIVVWIGGVFFVTFVLLPALRAFPVQERLPLFEKLERRFGWWARLAILLVGASGLFLARQIGFWQRIHESHLWPIHLMIVVWLIFALMLFVLEPFVVHRLFHRFALAYPERAMRIAAIVHWVLSALSFTAVVAGVMLAHGWPF